MRFDYILLIMLLSEYVIWCGLLWAVHPSSPFVKNMDSFGYCKFVDRYDKWVNRAMITTIFCSIVLFIIYVWDKCSN